MAADADRLAPHRLPQIVGLPAGIAVWLIWWLHVDAPGPRFLPNAPRVLGGIGWLAFGATVGTAFGGNADIAGIVCGTIGTLFASCVSWIGWPPYVLPIRDAS